MQWSFVQKNFTVTPAKVVTDYAEVVPLSKTQNPVGRLVKWSVRIAPYVSQIVCRSAVTRYHTLTKQRQMG